MRHCCRGAPSSAAQGEFAEIQATKGRPYWAGLNLLKNRLVRFRPVCRFWRLRAQKSREKEKKALDNGKRGMV